MSEQTDHLHWIEVERDHDGPSSVRFVCKGDVAAPCHSFPDCDCEIWTRELHGQRFGQAIGLKMGRRIYADSDVPPAPGHEDVVHDDKCWIDPWFNAALSDVEDWVEVYTGTIPRVSHPDGGTHDDQAWLVSGPIDTSFEGEYMTWEYA